MVYIIISNIGLALITIVMYIRYSHFRISSTLKIRELNKSLKAEKQAKKTLESQLRGEIKEESTQVKDALRDLEQARKERQEEIRLRLMAEKKIELATQKIKETESRVKEWQIIQDNALRTSQKNMSNINQELLKHLNATHKRETDESRYFIEQNMGDLRQNINNIERQLQEIRKNSTPEQIEGIKPAAKDPEPQKQPPKEEPEDSILKEAHIEEEPKEEEKLLQNLQIDEVAKKSLDDVVSLIEASDLTHLKDYILAAKLDENKAKFMLCDLVLLRDEAAYFIDFKADRFFKEVENLNETQMQTAIPVFQKRIDKYLAYISNPKYRALIEKLIKALKINYKDVKIIFAVRNRNDSILMRDLKYSEKAQKLNIEIFDVNQVNDLIL